ncbi:MAG: ferritin-like domain-containing protein [Deltaproteobacteria bacterium]|nr:ferritin-like domain-containing protein [Deltaproteobacteria bacterium]
MSAAGDSGPVELRALAERVLFGPTLADKLYAPARVTDERPGAPIALPGGPARDHALAFEDAAARRARKPDGARPTLDALRDPLARARLLHTFAHHELMALELMALALLRFPDAPAPFRRGLAGVMRDEQRHCQLYLRRVEALGLSLGEERVNDFFWRCVADAPTPHEWNARVGLVFEQANIDFTRYYEPAMRAVGDPESADALAEIYRDELSHVKHSLHWFRAWRPAGEPDWEHLCALLRPPLSPGRARGAVFSVEGRRAVGFDERFIDSLERWGGSVGRPPAVWLPNVSVEEEVSGRLAAPKARAAAEEARAALAPLVGWLCARGDVALAPPPSAPLQGLLLRARGFNPEWLPRVEDLGARKVAALSPWGWSADAAAALAPLAPHLIPSAPRPHEDLRHVAAHSKLWDVAQRPAVWDALEREGVPRAWLCEDEAVACRDEDALWRALEALHARHPHVAAKAALGAAGRGVLRLERGALSAPQRGWLRRQARAHGVTLEPWYPRALDLSFHGRVERVGDALAVRADGVVLSDVDARGAYRGAWLCAPTAPLSPALQRALTDDGRDPRRLRRAAEAATRAVGDALAALGYVGCFGLDALLSWDPARADDPAAARLHPLVEVNPRVTMGRLALALRESVVSPASGRAPGGARRFKRLRVLPRPRAADPAAPAAAWLGDLLAAPPAFDEAGRWVSGTLPLSDVWATPAPSLAVVACEGDPAGGG